MLEYDRRLADKLSHGIWSLNKTMTEIPVETIDRVYCLYWNNIHFKFW